jgi:hypothetical protein
MKMVDSMMIEMRKNSQFGVLELLDKETLKKEAEKDESKSKSKDGEKHKRHSHSH